MSQQVADLQSQVAVLLRLFANTKPKCVNEDVSVQNSALCDEEGVWCSQLWLKMHLQLCLL